MIKNFKSVDSFITHYRRTKGGYFFDPRYLEFLNEDIDEMRVERDLVEHTIEGGNTYTCYVLVSIQHLPKGLEAQNACPKRTPRLFNPRICRTFFDVETMRDVGREYGEFEGALT